jgi:hypothetical protein
MSNVLIYDKVTGSAISYLKYVNTPDYIGRSDVLINPDVSLFGSVEMKYCKIADGKIVEVSAAEKAGLDAAAPIEEKYMTFPEIKAAFDDLKARVLVLEKP